MSVRLLVVSEYRSLTLNIRVPGEPGNEASTGLRSRSRSGSETSYDQGCNFEIECTELTVNPVSDLIPTRVS